MKSEDIVRFLQLIRARNIEISPDNQWVRCSCPLAPYFHASGTDNHPSFGIKVNNGGLSNFNCFTCGSGTLPLFMHKITWTLGVSPDVHEFFIHREFLPEDAVSDQFYLEYKDLFSQEFDKPTPISVPSDVLAEYPRLSNTTGEGKYEISRVKDWLEDRGISYDLAVDYQIRVSPQDRAIVFPIVDTDGLTYLLHARSRVNKIFYYLNPSNTGHLDKVWGRKDFWFGIQHADMTKPLILVESETDLLRLRSLGVENVIASCGPVGDYKLERISSPKVYLGFDSDLGGAQYCARTINYLHSSSSLYRLSWTAVGAKDAGDLKSREEFDAVWDARRAVYVEGGQVFTDPIYDDPPEYNDRYSTRKEVAIS